MAAKVIRSDATRKAIQDRIKAALNKKPTASTLLHQTAPFEKLLKATGNKAKVPTSPVQKQSIAKSSAVRRRKSRPAVQHRYAVGSFDYCTASPILRLPQHYVLKTPDWFAVQGKPDVSVIVPLYNSVKEIGEQIETWQTDGLNVEIIYVDDLCPSQTKNHIVGLWEKKGRVPVGKIIANQENGGYGRACNIGAMYATADKLIFLNADTTVTPGWIPPIIELLNDESVGVVGNLQIKKGGPWHGRVDSLGSEWRWDAQTFSHIGRHTYHNKNLPEPLWPDKLPPDMEVDGEREMVTGCCVGLRASVFKELDGFNPLYQKGYWEDSEMCCLLKEWGYKVMFTPRSRIWHSQGHSNAGHDVRASNNMHFFINRWVRSGRIDKIVKEKRPQTNIVRSILVKRLAAHGDVIMATGVLPGLKKKHPLAEIDFFTAVPQVLHKNPYLRTVINHDKTLTQHYDLIVNLDNAYEYHPNWHMAESYADVAGIDVSEMQPMVVTEEPSFRLPSKYAVFHSKRQMPHDWIGRIWPENNYFEIAKWLKGMGYNIVVVGNQADITIPDCDIDLRGQTTMSHMSWVLMKASLFVGMDSMPMHMAMIHKTPGVAFFGCINPEKRLIGNSIVPVNAHWLDCIGCHHKKNPPTHGTTECERGDLACQTEVTVEQVRQAIDRALGNKRELPVVKK